MLDHEKTAARSPLTDSDAILNYLTTQQHLRPHSTIQQSLEQTIEQFGCCPQAVQRAMEWLSIDPNQSIGRFRRSELLQLARALHRFWVQNTTPASGIV